MNRAVDEDVLTLIRDSAEKVLKPDTAAVRRVRDEQSGFDVALWTSFADMGWLGIAAPETLGGGALGLRAAALIAERLGYGGRSEPFTTVSVLATSALVGCPQSPVRDRLLGSLISGENLVTMAWQPWVGALSVTDTPLRANAAANGLRVEGECFHVSDPPADEILMAAKSDVGVGLYLVPSSAADRVETKKCADGTLISRFAIDAVLARTALLSEARDMAQELDDAINMAVVSAAAEILGVIEKCLRLTKEYVCTREQFGRPIGAFQVLQHQLVDMWIQVRLVRAALDSALNIFESDISTSEQRAAAASSVKARASCAALFVVERAVQLHGAIGMTDEYDLGVFVNRALTLASQFGNQSVHRRRYSNLVQLKERDA